MQEPYDQRNFTAEQYWFWREKHKEMAQKGWLEPTLSEGVTVAAD